VATEQSNQLGLKSFVKQSNKPGFTGWQTYIGDLIKDRKKDLNKFNSIVVSGFAGNKDQEATISLITNEGNSYSASFKLKDTLSKITIPLSNFKQSDMLLLPRPYPGFQPLYYDSQQSEKLEIKNTEKIGVTFSN